MNVARYFDRTASAFDALYDDDTGSIGWFNHLFRRGLYERVQQTVRELEGLEAPSVLDVGCGSGRNSVVFVESGARRVVGIDFADQMLKLARERARGTRERAGVFGGAPGLRRAAPRATVLCRTGRVGPLGDESF